MIKQKITLVDSTKLESYIWEAVLDSSFYCYVTQISEALYCLYIEEIDTEEVIERRYFNHFGPLTDEYIESLYDSIEETIDTKYYAEGYS